MLCCGERAVPTRTADITWCPARTCSRGEKLCRAGCGLELLELTTASLLRATPLARPSDHPVPIRHYTDTTAGAPRLAPRLGRPSHEPVRPSAPRLGGSPGPTRRPLLAFSSRDLRPGPRRARRQLCSSTPRARPPPRRFRERRFEMLQRRAAAPRGDASRAASRCSGRACGSARHGACELLHVFALAAPRICL